MCSDVYGRILCVCVFFQNDAEVLKRLRIAGLPPGVLLTYLKDGESDNKFFKKPAGGGMRRIKFRSLTWCKRKRAQLKKQVKRVGIVSILTSIILAAGAFAENLTKSYYSIHLASFKYLHNANRHVNSLQMKGMLVFWEKVEIPGKGEFYRVFCGKYDNRSDAVAYWEELNKKGAVSYFGVYEFKETVKPSMPVTLRGRGFKPQPLHARFVDNHDGTVTDTQTDLMWIRNGWRLDFVSAVTWQEAIEKCKNFRVGGYSDWRLSTVDEWKTLIDTNNRAPALVEPNPFENIIVHMPYWSHSEFFPVNTLSVRPALSMRAFTVMLYTGEIHNQKKTDRAFVMPVRTIK